MERGQEHQLVIIVSGTRNEEKKPVGVGEERKHQEI